jgi:uncharacterized membrane protein YfcA
MRESGVTTIDAISALTTGVNAAPLAALAAIYGVAAVMSGLSGFGFSAIGCLSFAVLTPELAVAMLMGLSLLTQISGAAVLWRELRGHMTPWHRRDGVIPYLAGGIAGMPIGLALLSGLALLQLKVGLGAMLIGYAAWSLLRAPTARVRATPNAARSFLVGAAGGVVGGFSAFPGSALVVWNAISGVGKEQGRALTQAFILSMQVVGLSLLLVRHPAIFGPAFWGLFLAAAPVALLGNRIGLAIYRRTGDIGYRRVTLAVLGAAGFGLLLQLALQ